MTRFLAGLLFLVLAPAANAATTIGSTNPSTVSDAYDATYVQATSPTDGPSYPAPPGNWVLTSFSARLATSGGTRLNAAGLVARPTATAGDYEIRRILGFDLQENQAESVVTTAAGVPVKGGDVIGLRDDLDVKPFYAAAPGARLLGRSGGVNEGSTETFDTHSPDLALGIAATLEPDADEDGAGDETQDACPADADRQVPPCSADFSAEVMVAPQSGVVGTDFTVTVAVKNNSPRESPVRGILGWGQSVTPLTSSDPSCPVDRAAITCDFGTLAAGARRTVNFTFDSLYAEATAFNWSVQGTAGDPVAANNTASAPFTITAAQAPPPGGTPPPAGSACSLSAKARAKLKKKSLKAAKKAVKQAGCAVKVKRPKKVKKGRVLRVSKVTVKGDTATVTLKAVKKKK